MCDCDRNVKSDVQQARPEQAQRGYPPPGHAPRFDESARRLGGAGAGGAIAGGGALTSHEPQSPYGGFSLGAETERVSSPSMDRSHDSHARTAVIQKRLQYRLEAQRNIANEIRELRRALDLSRQYDIAALSEYLELIQKHGL